MIGQHAPQLEVGRRLDVHRTMWIAVASVVLLALVAAIGILVGLNLWGSGITVLSGEELQRTLIDLRQSLGGGGFI